MEDKAAENRRKAKLKRNAAIAGTPSTLRVKRNWLIHTLFVRQDFNDCLEVIHQQLTDSRGQSEYPLYIKALILRQQGKVAESLQLFQTVLLLNPHDLDVLKQVGRSLYLLGKHPQAIQIYSEVQKCGVNDWEVWHNKGLSFMYLKRYDDAVAAFKQANEIQKMDATFIQLGKVYTLQENFDLALEVYAAALEFSPENSEILTTVGLLHLRLGDNELAFKKLGTSHALDPHNSKTILAKGSILQDHNEMDTALSKYRIAAVKAANSCYLWNNIGMCFFGKQSFTPAIVCLKHAHYLDPFEWIISYNLGLVHLNTGQYASAFHYLSASITIKTDFAHSFMYLGVALARLDDFANACVAYRKAIDMEADHLFHLNFAITLVKHGEYEEALDQYRQCMLLWNELDDEGKSGEADVIAQLKVLGPVMQELRSQLSSAAAPGAAQGPPPLPSDPAGGFDPVPPPVPE